MASPISFKVQAVDAHRELMARVEAAPQEHAEALLVAWDLLQTSHDQGVLDLLQGLIGGKDILVGKLAVAGKSDEGIAVLRNALAMGRILGSFDPDLLQKVARALESEPAKTEEKPPSLWRLFRQMTSADARRGLGFAAGLLVKLGGALKSSE